MQDVCFCAWLIKNPAYAVGQLTLASSLRLTHPGIPRLLLITEDVEDAVLPFMKLLFTHIVRVPYIEKHVVHNWERFREFYSDWINCCFTRFTVFKAAKLCGFKRVLVLDSDMLALHSLPELLDETTIAAPAGLCSLIDEPPPLPQEDKAGGQKRFMSMQQSKRYESTARYSRHELDFQVLDRTLVQQSALYHWGMRGCFYIFPTGDDIYEDMLKTLSLDVSSLKSGGRVYCGPDERIVTDFFNQRKFPGSVLADNEMTKSNSSKSFWSSIPATFCNKSWVGDEVAGDREYPRTIHYVTQKPWWRTSNLDKSSKLEWWPDFNVWYLEALVMLRSVPQSVALFDPDMLKTSKIKLKNNIEVIVQNTDECEKFVLSPINESLQAARRQWTQEKLASNIQVLVMEDEFDRVRILSSTTEPCIEYYKQGKLVKRQEVTVPERSTYSDTVLERPFQRARQENGTSNQGAMFERRSGRPGMMNNRNPVDDTNMKTQSSSDPFLRRLQNTNNNGPSNAFRPTGSRKMADQKPKDCTNNDADMFKRGRK